MKKTGIKYNFIKYLSSTLMILTLLWLTVSIPFVAQAQQDIAMEDRCPSSTDLPMTDDGDSPFSNTTEEKTESGVNSLSEYLHDLYMLHVHVPILVKYEKGHHPAEYSAFHGELLCPPPNA